MQEKSGLGDLFDPKADLSINEHIRPHWSQTGAIVFITFRTADSIPREVIQRWEREKQDWIERNVERVEEGEELRSEWGTLVSRSEKRLSRQRSKTHWSNVVPTLSESLQKRFNKEFNRIKERSLDSCQGECVLRRPELARIVADTLLFFDGDRYSMGDFVVMPNHVHLLAAFASGQALVAQFDSWLHYSARQINLALGRKGKFWQQEPFDHLVRSVEQYDYLRKYIHENGLKAGLSKDEYLLRVYEP